MIYQDVELYNVAEILTEQGGHVLLRVPQKVRSALNPAAFSRARYPTGCEIRFNFDGPSVKVTLQCLDDEYLTYIPSVVEVFQGSFLLTRHLVGREPTDIVVTPPPNLDLLEQVSREKGLPFDARLTRVLLPHFAPVRLLGIEGRTTLPQVGQAPSFKYLAYGSSITHGNAARAPSGTYVSRVGQLLGADVINLGFGAAAHCEGALADYIAESRGWQVATLELGINMIGVFESEEFERRARYFVTRIVEAHPGSLIACIDMFTFYPWQPQLHAATLTKQAEFRGIVREVVRQLARPRLVYLDGRELLTDLSTLTYDLVHPAPAGMEEIARNLAKVLANDSRVPGAATAG